MAIQYKETIHRCECECGQGFYVSVGNIDKKKLKPTVHTATRCPACDKTAWLSSTASQHTRRTIKPESQLIEPSLLFDDLPVMEETIHILQRDFHLARNQLMALAAVARTAAQHWDQHWHRAFMPREFEAILRTLKEIDQLPILRT